MNSEDADRPVAVGSSEGLGRLDPERQSLLRAAFEYGSATTYAEQKRARAAVFEALDAILAAERERCAKVCEHMGPVLCESYGDGAECIATADACAEAIRRA